MSDPAKQAAAEIADKVMGYREFDVEATAEIIQRALLSAQRPYVEWIMDDAHHADSCAFTDWVEEKPGVFVHPDNHPNLRLHCTCGLQKLRDELRKQVGGEGEWVLFADHAATLSSLQAKHDRAVKALQKIAAGEGYYGAMASEYKTIAKQALADEVTDERSLGFVPKSEIEALAEKWRSHAEQEMESDRKFWARSMRLDCKVEAECADELLALARRKT